MTDETLKHDEVAVASGDAQDDTVNRLALKTLQNDGRLKPEACLKRFSNKIVKNNASNPTYQMDIDADYLILESSDNALRYLPAINETVSITTAGAGGLDTPSEAPSTWYHIWIIYNDTTLDVSSLLSTSSTSPSMPSGYDFKILVGAIYNNGGSDFRNLYQIDNVVAAEEVQILNNGNAGASETPISLTAVTPPTAKFITGHARAANVAAAVTDGTLFAFLGGVKLGRIIVRGYSNQDSSTYYKVPIISNEIYYTTALGVTSEFDVWASGWVF